jgi:chromosome segregation ATPase
VTSYSWVNTVYAQLLAVPGYVIDTSTTTRSTLQLCLNYADTLSRNPQDPIAKSALQNSLKLLVELQPLVSVQNCVNKINSFNSDLPALASSLDSIVKQAEADTKVDKQKLADLKKAIDNLNNEISNLKKEIGILSAATGVMLIIGGACTILIPEVGWLIWFIVGPAAAITAALVAYDVGKLLKAQQDVSKKNGDADNLTQALAALDKMAKDVKVLAGSVDEMKKAAEAILKAWKSLYDATSKAAGDLVTALNETSGQKPDYQKVKSELETAVAHWGQVHDAAVELQIDAKASSVKADFGQLKDTVEKALSAPKMSYLEYTAA